MLGSKCTYLNSLSASQCVPWHNLRHDSSMKLQPFDSYVNVKVKIQHIILKHVTLFSGKSLDFVKYTSIRQTRFSRPKLNGSSELQFRMAEEMCGASKPGGPSVRPSGDSSSTLQIRCFLFCSCGGNGGTDIYNIYNIYIYNDKYNDM